MPSDIYVALSGQIAMDKRLATVANNVANMRTAGFRAQTVNFETVLSEYRVDRVSFAAIGTTHLERQAGPIERTGNALDVAIVGQGWFGVETPAGQGYSRDGRFTVDADGTLTTVSGLPVLDDGAAPIIINPAAGPVDISADGRMSQDGRFIANLGLFELAPTAQLTRFGDTALLSNQEAVPVEDRVVNGVRQGYKEGSNVNAITSITELIMVQRAFEYGNTAIGDRQQSLQQAVRTLGAE